MRVLIVTLMCLLTGLALAGTTETPTEAAVNLSFEAPACATDQASCAFSINDDAVEYRKQEASELVANSCADQCRRDKQCDSVCGAKGAGACIITFPSGCSSWRRVCACTF